MAKRVRVYDVQRLISEVDQRLHALSADVDRLTLREKVLRLVDLQFKSRCLGVSVVASDGLSETAAMDRIRVYLQRYVGIVIDGAELDVVSGISEYARRIRQLRVEQGYRILTGASPDRESGVDLKVDQYLLTSAIVDPDAARRWHVANRIRRSPGGSKSKILAYLQENVGKVVTTEELSYVSGSKSEFGRRTRELRTEDGFAIATKTTGRPDLGIGEYVLLTANRVAEPHDRHIPADVQRQVYERDDNRCQNAGCNWSIEQWSTTDARILELHHIQSHASGGANSVQNLVVLCSKCHDDIHANRLVLDKRL